MPPCGELLPGAAQLSKKEFFPAGTKRGGSWRAHAEKNRQSNHRLNKTHTGSTGWDRLNIFLNIREKRNLEMRAASRPGAAQMQNIIDFPIEPVGTRVLEDRVVSILPYFDDSRLPPWARHLTRPARAAAATLLRQARQWRAPMKVDLPLVKEPFAQMRPKTDRLSEICAPCP